MRMQDALQQLKRQFKAITQEYENCRDPVEKAVLLEQARSLIAELNELRTVLAHLIEFSEPADHK
jgi:regulator of replication initiation timing